MQNLRSPGDLTKANPQLICDFALGTPLMKKLHQSPTKGEIINFRLRENLIKERIHCVSGFNAQKRLNQPLRSLASVICLVLMHRNSKPKITELVKAGGKFFFVVR